MSAPSFSPQGFAPAPLGRALAALVGAYQRLTRGWLAPRCRFSPSCSTYAHRALLTLPVGRALPRVLWRLLRCQPFAAGGHDPVPRPRSRRLQRGAA